MTKDKFPPEWDDSDDTVGKKAREDAVKHYEDAHYRQDFTPNPADESMMGHNQIVWLQNECKRLVKERDEEHKLKQEAEGELSIMKGIETNRVKEAQAKSAQLQDELDRVKLDNNNLYTRVADALEVNEHHQNLNGKLQARLTAVEEENEKINKHLDKQLDKARTAGL